MLRACVAFLLCILLPSAALAQKRVALVIGNSAYQSAPALANPRNDATDMSAALKKHGFQVVEGFDLDKPSFDRKVRDFADALTGAKIGVFFFAGHGLQVAGANYLVPVDAKLSTASALDWEMVRLDLVQRTMERETETNVLFLDACRDNPLARNLARAMGTRSGEISRGLAATEAGVGTLISFSTQPGNVALDGAGRNSPFAGALAKRIASSNDDLSALLIDVRNDVRKETQNKQVPWEHSALTGRFYFNPAAATASPPAVAPARLSEAAEAWGAVKDATSIPALEAYIARFKDTFYAELARQRVEELKKQQVAATSPAAARPAAPEKQGLLPGLIDQTVGVILPRDKAAPAKPAEPAIASPAPALKPAQCDGVQTTVGNERRCLKPKDTFKDCDTCPEMVVVPAGRITMGSPNDEPQRESLTKGSENQLSVTIAKPFGLGRFAVTRGEFAAFAVATGHETGGCFIYTGSEWKQQPDKSWRSPGFTQTDRHPVVCVNWHDAKAYVAWLASATGKSYRLMSETEREYATRAGTTTPFWWGPAITPAQANYNSTAAGPYSGSLGEWRKAPLPVDSFAANPWGLYNVHGNVWEWTEDCANDSNTGNPTDGHARATGDCTRRVLRGGSWFNSPQMLRSAVRVWNYPDFRSIDTGFRVARMLD